MAMKIDRIQPAGMNVRMQQGKPAYSHVVTVTGECQSRARRVGLCFRPAHGAPDRHQ
jgi:hypothetical protein